MRKMMRKKVIHYLILLKIRCCIPKEINNWIQRAIKIIIQAIHKVNYLHQSSLMLIIEFITEI